MKRLFIILSFFCAFQTSFLFAEPKSTTVPYTLEDRDRQIRLEERIILFEKSVDQRFEQLNYRFDDFKSFMTMIVSIFVAIMLSSMGLTVWDRKTALKKADESAERKIERLAEEGKLGKLINALRIVANDDPKLAEALRKFNLL